MTIKVEIKNHIATVTLSRPEVHNAFNQEMVKGLTDNFLNLGKDPQIRVIVLTGEGKSFCAGGDLNWMKSMINFSFNENVEDANKLVLMLKTINECPRPVIGKINGSAFGGGVGLISVCDIAVSIKSAIFSLSEVKIGLIPGVISSFVLSKINMSAARRYFLTAEKFSSDEAKRIGLISEVAEVDNELDRVAEGWVNCLKQNAPNAISISKSLLKEISANKRQEDILSLSAKLIAECRASQEGQEGMKAFLEKRQPSWLK